jgi:hypothetical protein
MQRIGATELGTSAIVDSDMSGPLVWRAETANMDSYLRLFAAQEPVFVETTRRLHQGGTMAVVLASF